MPCVRSSYWYMYRAFRIRCTKLQDVIIWVIFSLKCYVNLCPIINRYIATSIVIFQDTVRCCTTSDLNHLHAYSHPWQTLLPRSLFREAHNSAYRTMYVALSSNQCHVTETWHSLINIIKSKLTFFFVSCWMKGNEKARFKLALRKYLNTQSSYSVDKFFLCKDDL
jgi:hypothetical protein